MAKVQAITGKPLADGGAEFTPPKRIFQTADKAPAVPALKAGAFEANGHNIVYDWRDPGELAIKIGVDADALAAVFTPAKRDGGEGKPTLARSAGTMFHSTLVETPDGRRWYLTVKAEEAVAKPKGGK